MWPASNLIFSLKDAFEKKELKLAIIDCLLNCFNWKLLKVLNQLNNPEIAILMQLVITNTGSIVRQNFVSS